MDNRILSKVFILALTFIVPGAVLAIFLIPQSNTSAAASFAASPPQIKQSEFILPAANTLINASTTYTITDLGTLGGTESEAFAISKNGQIAGEAWLPGDSGNDAFRSFKGAMKDLGTLGGSYSSGYGINNRGQVVGESLLAGDKLDHAFLYSGTLMTDLGTIGGSYSLAWGINNHSAVVGETEFNANSSDVHAFVYTNTVMTDLGVLGNGLVSHAYAINDSGQVVGESGIDSSNTTHAFLYSNGVMHNLGTLGGDSSGAYAVNDKGDVTGWSALPSGKNVAFIYSGGTMRQVGGSLGGDTYAYGINDRQQIVGVSHLGSGSLRHAIFIENGQMYDLNNLIPAGSGWVLEEAYAINDSGQIVGYGSVHGQTHAFLLTPPQPWTVMVYLDSDTNLITFTTQIFNHLELVADNPYVRVVTLWDPPGQNDSAYYAIQYDTNLKRLADYTTNIDYFPQGELNMGDPNTLANFIAWARTNYPARHYALILADHGTGLNGSMKDDQNPSDLLTVKEMGTALNAATSSGKNKIDVFEEYACLMGMLEDSFQVRNYVNYYVASENEMWADAAPFNLTVSNILSTTTPAQLAVLAATQYAAVEQSSQSPFTVSALDLSQVNTLTTTINTLSQILTSRMITASATLSNIVSPAVQRYDADGNNSITVTDIYMDLFDFASLVKSNFVAPDIKAAAQGVMNSINSYVIYESHGSGNGPGKTYWDLNNSHGLSIFFPYTKSSFYNGANLDLANGVVWETATRAVIASTAGWGNMLASYVLAVDPAGADQPNPPNPVPLLFPPSKIYVPLVVR
jgi:probable HAF family extracellular repeat protein